QMPEARQRFGLPPDRRVVAFAGALIRAKGLFELVAAAASLEADRPILALAGTGPDRQGLDDLARRDGVDVRFFGHLAPPDVGALFAAADAVALPSYSEGLPNVVCEAMLSERAVVASTVGGIPEIIEDGRTGLLVPPQSAQPLAAALRRILSDDALRASMALAAREFARTHLTWDVSARGYDAVYRKALNAGTQTPSTSPRRTMRA
ncbi:MAG TPA: glycosyltransferase family 4 protein, partial [Candidatus Baltobacteraceae bacterium]|nr:glycosyltransferase family 4 protein [Candidatus Baltobacteraceae bacterium]